jgi:hypothetical protein
VHVRNQTRLVVKAMKGYLAPGGKTNAAAVTNIASANAPALLRDLLQSPISVSGVQLSATVSSFRGVARANTVAVSVEIRAGDIKLVEKNGTFNGALSLVVRAVDNSGAVRASTSPTVNVALRPETYHRLAGDSKFRFVSQLDLPAGRYQLQAAVLDGVTNKRGSVYHAFEVPEAFAAVEQPCAYIGPHGRIPDRHRQAEQVHAAGANGHARILCRRYDSTVRRGVRQRRRATPSY